MRTTSNEVPLLSGNSSVGRAQPCQGWGREFESRFPLHTQASAASASPVLGLIKQQYNELAFTQPPVASAETIRL